MIIAKWKLSFFVKVIFAFAWTVFFSYTPIQVQAQNFELVDSLIGVVKVQKQDTNKVKTLLALSKVYQRDSLLASVKYANDAIKLANEIKYSNGISEGCRKIAVAYYFQNNYDEATKYYAKAIAVDEKSGYLRGLSASFNNLGLIYETKGDYPNAINYFLKGLSLNEKTKNYHGISSSLSNVGLVYEAMGKYDEALDAYTRAYNIAKEHYDVENLAGACINIGLSYEVKGDHKKALEYMFEGLKIYEKLGVEQMVALSFTNIAINYEMLNENKKATEYYDKALQLNLKNNNKEGLISSYMNLGEFYRKTKDYNKALGVLQQGLELSKELEIKRKTMKIESLLAEVYFDMGEGNQAYEWHKKAVATKDSIYTEESAEQMAEAEGKYQNEKKQLEIEKLEKEKLANEAEIKRQNVQKIAFASGFGLMLILAFVIFRGYRQKQKANEIISLQKVEVEKQKEIVEEKNTLVEEQKKHIEEKHKEITDSITYAKRLQQAILPPDDFIKKCFPDSFVLYKPKDIVAGDFYWMETVGEVNKRSSEVANKPNSEVVNETFVTSSEVEKSIPNQLILFAAADCTGHGVPGAMVSVVCSNALNRAVKEFGFRHTGEILDKVTELVVETFEKSTSEVKDGMDISLLSYHPQTKKVQWSGANNPLWYVQNGELKEIKADKQPVGKFDNRKPFTTNTIELDGTLVFYLFTDGLPDQFGGAKGKKFLYKRFEEILLSNSNLSMEEQKHNIDKVFENWRGALEQVDDVTVIGIRI